jgi:hypothetical protein
MERAVVGKIASAIELKLKGSPGPIGPESHSVVARAAMSHNPQTFVHARYLQHLPTVIPAKKKFAMVTRCTVAARTRCRQKQSSKKTRIPLGKLHVLLLSAFCG